MELFHAAFHELSRIVFEKNKQRPTYNDLSTTLELKVQEAGEALKEVQEADAKANKEEEEKKERERRASARSNRISARSRARSGAAGAGFQEQPPAARNLSINLPSQPSPRASPRRSRKPR
jgi:hypothetical protein